MSDLDAAFSALSQDPDGVIVLERNGNAVAALVTMANLSRIEVHRRTAAAYIAATRKPTRKERHLRATERAREAKRLEANRKAQRTAEHERNRAKKERGANHNFSLVPGEGGFLRVPMEYTWTSGTTPNV